MQLPRATRLVVRIAGERMYLWRAVDDEGEVLDMLVQRRRDSRAALRLMRKLLKKQGFAPKLLVTDKLRSYASAFRRLKLTCPHESGLRKNRTRIRWCDDASASCFDIITGASLAGRTIRVCSIDRQNAAASPRKARGAPFWTRKKGGGSRTHRLSSMTGSDVFTRTCADA